MGGEHQDVSQTTKLTREEKEALGEQIAQHAAHLDAATHRLLTDIRVFDQAGGWYLQGAASCAAWLSWRVGCDAGTAREHVRVANRLGSLAAIDDELRRGKLSYSKVRALTRVATPTNEALLLEDARYSTGNQLEQICRKYASVVGRKRSLRDDTEARRVTRRERADGMVEISAVLRPDEALVVWEALNKVARERSVSAADATQSPNAVPSVDAVPATTNSRAETLPEPPVARNRFSRADALVQLSDEVLRGSAPDRTPTEIVVTVAAEALSGTSPDAFPIGCAADGTVLSIDTVRRLACDAGIVVLAEDANGTTLNLGRRSRSATTALKRALYKRDRKCRFPGCENNLFLDVHHCMHWANGGETDVKTTILICRRHHPFMHEYGYSVTLDANQEPLFTDPRGRIVPATPALPPSAGMPDLRRLTGPMAITANTNCPRWDGKKVDYGLVIDGLLHVDGRR